MKNNWLWLVVVMVFAGSGCASIRILPIGERMEVHKDGQIAYVQKLVQVDF